MRCPLAALHVVKLAESSVLSHTRPSTSWTRPPLAAALLTAACMVASVTVPGALALVANQLTGGSDSVPEVIPRALPYPQLCTIPCTVALLAPPG